MNVLLIVPPNITYQAFINPGQNTKSWTHANGKELGVIITDVPLGALTLSAWLKDHFDAHVKVLDFNTLLHKEWDHPDADNFENWFVDTFNQEEFQNFKPDLIGFSSLFVTGYENLLLLGKITKRLFPKAWQIVGGNVATTMYEELFSDDDGVFDALCYGEGELPISDFLSAEDKTAYLDASPNWITRKNLQQKALFSQNYIQDLDEIPRLDYAAIDLKDYHFSPTIQSYTNVDKEVNYITYMTSRGCPFLCTFCSAHTVHGRKMRYFSLERIRDELTYLVETYGIKTLVLEDDHFLSDKKRAHAILKIAKSLDLVCFFPNALALYALDYDMLKALHDTGVRQLTLAVESGSARVLKQVMKKPLNLKIIKEVTKNCNDLGIYTDCNIIIGMPGENMDDIEETRAFLKTITANWYRINVATPLAGSEMYINAKENNQIKGDIRAAGYKNCVVETDDFTPDQIEKIAYDLNLELNFLHNIDIKHQNYDRAIGSFENVLRLKNDHALAMYCLFLCHDKKGDKSRALSYKKQLTPIVQNDPFWGDFFERHEILSDAAQ